MHGAVEGDLELWSKLISISRSLGSRLKFQSKRGSIMVDAAISIPIFVLAMCSVLGMINKVGKEETGVAKMLSLSQVSCKAIATTGLDVVEELVLYDEGHILLYRPFVGEPSYVDTDRVFIFPKAGIRYHIQGCSTMRDGQLTEILTDTLRRKYSPCKICDPDRLPNGATVCVYSGVSKLYHRQSCATVTKSYECITKKEAINQGYTACQLCLKNSNWNFEK